MSMEMVSEERHSEPYQERRHQNKRECAASWTIKKKDNEQDSNDD